MEVLNVEHSARLLRHGARMVRALGSHTYSFALVTPAADRMPHLDIGTVSYLDPEGNPYPGDIPTSEWHVYPKRSEPLPLPPPENTKHGTIAFSEHHVSPPDWAQHKVGDFLAWQRSRFSQNRAQRYLRALASGITHNRTMQISAAWTVGINYDSRRLHAQILPPENTTVTSMRVLLALQRIEGYSPEDNGYFFDVPKDGRCDEDLQYVIRFGFEEPYDLATTERNG